METNREQAKKTIEKLVEQFKEQYASYHKNTYDEATLRIDFINKFFKALGWDVDNVDGLAEDYREVIYEDKLKIGKSTKAPDYGFRLSGSDKRLFFVEAKKPAVPIKTDKSAAYQLRRYGRSAQTPVSILTNFEEFVIYDCSKTPSENDSAAVNRIKYLKYEDYIAEFDFIYDTFSREGVVKGRFDKFVQSDTNKRGSVPLDKEFVEVLNNWRKELAVSIAKNNQQLNEEQLNFAVQQTIDRLIFLRFCEDRAVEHYGNLKNTTTKGHTYQNLLAVFTEADNKYNSGLFDFEKDTITKKLEIDNKVIKNIVLELYYPKCEYEFSVLPVEILGNAYEQFLGKVIRITAAHSAKIDDKPEVRKAGGVYYTPQYIVDYIVAHTVGELVKGKSPKEIEQVKIVDPACGSGSFLLGAFKYLVKHYTDWYIANGFMEKKNGGGKLTAAGRLVTAEKRKILLTHIYGVDLDSNAVEVSKLSLLLKSMEGETQASINQQLGLHHERILPDLDKNIICGNSLIGHDFFDSELGFEGQEKLGLLHKIKPFDWQAAFPNVFKQGGFDAVVGNPPYGADITKPELNYVVANHPEVRKYPDSYCSFISQAGNLLKKDGLLGFIVPNTFCDLENCDEFRHWFLTSNQLLSILQTGWAFKDAVVDTLVFFTSKSQPRLTQDVIITVNNKTYTRKVSDFIENHLHKIDYRNNSENLLILSKLTNYKPLSVFAEIKAGVKLYEKGKGAPPQTEKVIKERPFTVSDNQPKGWQPLFRGENVNRYLLKPVKEYVNYGPWLAAPRTKELFDSPKILMRRTDDVLKSCIDTENSICVNSCHVIKLNDHGLKLMSYSFLLGLLNSKLLQFVFGLQNPQMIGKTFSEIKVIYVERLPIKHLDITQPKEKSLHDKIIQHVDTLLDLKNQLQTNSTPAAQQQLENRITYTDKKINELVYELYELNEEEIGIIEGTTEVK